MSDQGPVTAPKESVQPTPAPATATTDKAPVQDQIAKDAPQEDVVGKTKTEVTDKGKPPATTEDVGTFFDPKDLSDELIPAYKQMQAAFTKKTKAIKEGRQKIEAYDAFMGDIHGNLRQAAEQYGYKLVPAHQGTPPQAGVEGGTDFLSPDYQPQTYGQLYQDFKSKIMGDLVQQFNPIFKSVQDLSTNNVERQLADIDPQWKVYEDEMTDNLRKHPTLAHDVSSLYRMSVPDEVLNSRAVQIALKKMETKAQSAKIQGKGSTAPTAPKTGKLSFNDAVDEAKRTLAAGGIKP